MTEKKTGKKRSCQLSYDERKAFKEYAKRNGLKENDYLFPSRGTDKSKHIHRTSVYRVFKAVAKNCNMPGIITPHSCRKAYALKIYAKTGNIEAVRRELNHSNANTTLVYLVNIPNPPKE